MTENRAQPYLHHTLYGLPLAALAHTIVQFTWDWNRATALKDDLLLAVSHFLLGMLVGFPVFFSAFIIQAFVFVKLLQVTKNQYYVVLSGAIVQTAIVACWAIFIGIQPSAGVNRFPMNPVMVATAGLVGALVSRIALRKRARQNP